MKKFMVADLIKEISNIVFLDIDDTIVTGYWKENGNQPIQKVISFVNSLDKEVIIVTGRSEQKRRETEDLLNSIGIKYSNIYMNPYSENESNKHKEEIAEMYQNRVFLAIDDNENVRSIYRKYGIKAIDPVSI